MPRFSADPPRLIVLLLFLAGCGAGARSESQSPQSLPPGQDSGHMAAEGQEEGPATLEEAEADLRRAQAELSDALGQVAFAQPPPPASQAAPAPAPAEASGGAPRDQRSVDAEKKAEAGPGPNCQLACRAFASLSRAAQAVCRLDGDAGERCGRARQAVSDAEARVSSCACTRP